MLAPLLVAAPYPAIASGKFAKSRACYILVVTIKRLFMQAAAYEVQHGCNLGCFDNASSCGEYEGIEITSSSLRFPGAGTKNFLRNDKNSLRKCTGND
jgi:hypothetical protein